ncbi:MAG: hypothetical protein FJX52_06140 [Alphaproteobacteria bacterium]|nr:hypothetical protein [Alphaproteobacteria bacterium]
MAASTPGVLVNEKVNPMVYRRHIEISVESIRLCALGLLAEQPRCAPELAEATRSFVDHVLGPSPDVMAANIQMLEIEGLVERAGHDGASAPERPLRLTEAGRAELGMLLNSPLEGQSGGSTKLAVAAKLRFLTFLAPRERETPIDLLVDATRREMARLAGMLRVHTAGNFVDWLSFEIGQLERRVEWLDRLKGEALRSVGGLAEQYEVSSSDHGNYGWIRATILRIVKRAKSSLLISDPGGDIVPFLTTGLVPPQVEIRILVTPAAADAVRASAERLGAARRQIEARQAGTVQDRVLAIDGAEVWQVEAVPGAHREPAFRVTSVAEAERAASILDRLSAAWLTGRGVGSEQLRPRQANAGEVLQVPKNLGAEHADFAKAVAYIDGAFVPYVEARISVRDFGLTHADLTYDVIHTWKGGFFRLDDHLDRFETSLKGMRLNLGMSRKQLRDILAECVRRTGLKETLVYFACTRGAPPLGSRDPTKAVNSFFAHAQPLVLRGSPEEMRRGMAIKISETVRRIPADSVNPVWKNVHWGDFTRALLAAKDESYDSVVLTDHQGRITEGPGFNIVALINGKLVTPDFNVLEGVSLKTMFELVQMIGVPAEHGTLTPEDLRNADEVFITSTSCGLFPVTRIDGRVLANGAVGPVATRLLNLYYQKKNEGWHLTPIKYD